MSEKKISKFLSFVLRHKPEVIGLELDENGWANTSELLEKANSGEYQLTIDQLKAVVANNDKQRFMFSADFSRIRASQGHSVAVDLQYEPASPPDILYHGTAEINLNAIREQGILKRERHHVHLSANAETALKVGSRHGKPVVLTIRSGEMHREGFTFFKSDNGVWLTDEVKPEFITFPV